AHHGPLLWCGLNAYVQPMEFSLPSCPRGWLRLIDTSLPPGDDLPSEGQPWQGSTAPLASNSLMLLVASPLMQGHRL
ncbi:MAG: glycogen-debranching protein, partial [Synechococcaceae bacterium WB9_2_170]|nr:glycogen-debranching protein [Synechococcaceae bacterium WB9_2_170]